MNFKKMPNQQLAVSNISIEPTIKHLMEVLYVKLKAMKNKFFPDEKFFSFSTISLCCSRRQVEWWIASV